MRDDVTVSAADVARLAGVGRAAVSNWRRRYDDFPEPVGGTASSPLFALQNVEGWLRAQGKLREEVPAEERVWQRVRASADDLHLAETVADAGAFLLYLERVPREWAEVAQRDDRAVAEHLAQALAARLRDVPGAPPASLDDDMVPVLRAVAELAAEWGAARTFEFLCGRYFEAHSRWVATTSPEVADLMAALADVGGGEVLDPACGTGALLLASLPYEPAHLAGQELEGTGARIAATRALLRGADVTVAAGDSLRDDAFPQRRADAVLCNPPFNERGWGYEELADDPRWEYGVPPRGEPELAWVQHALARTHAGGRVVMLMPPAVASRRSGRRLRAELLRGGALRAVIALPAGAAPLSAAAPHLWVLRRPDRDGRSPQHVLMADVSAFDGSWRQLHETVERTWRSYLRGPDETLRQPGVSVAVGVIDLLDEDVELTPARHVPQRAAAAGAEFARTRDRLAASVADLARTIPDLDVPADAREEAGPPLTMTTIGEQAKAGTLAVHQSALRMPSESGDVPVLTAQDVTLGRAPTGETREDPGQVRLRAGDVVLPAVTRRVAVRVVSEGGGVLGPHLFLVRSDSGRFDPDFLAGFLRISGRASAARTHSGSSRIDVRKARFPLVPLGEQRRYGAAFRQLADLEDTLRAANDLGAAVVRMGLDGLAEGSLRPGE